MDSERAFAYLDHNVIDLIRKGDPADIVPFMKKINVTPVFSTETLLEIRNTKDGVCSFLNTLSYIEAEYIQPQYNEDGRPNRNCIVEKISPTEAYNRLFDNPDLILTEFLHKLTLKFVVA